MCIARVIFCLSFLTKMPVIFFGLCLTSELCSTGTVTDLTGNSQTLREHDFEPNRDLNRCPPPHDSSSGGDSVYRLSAIPSVSFGLIPSLSAASVPYLYRKCQYQAMVTSTVRKNPRRLSCQKLALQDPATDLAVELLEFYLVYFEATVQD